MTLFGPRTVMLMVFTALTAMLMASTTVLMTWGTFIFALIGITLTACVSSTINNTMIKRLIPTGYTITIVAVLSIVSTAILFFLVNSIAAMVNLFILISAVVVYSVFLKRTPYNIVLAGFVGALLPLLGWSAVIGHIDTTSFLLVLILFAWTPPHFWALTISRHKEFEETDIPTLLVTHGMAYTKLNILLYTLLLIAITYLPFIIDMTGLIYLIGVTILNAAFLYHAACLYRKREKVKQQALTTFHYSIFYLFALFALLLIDHVIPLLT